MCSVMNALTSVQPSMDQYVAVFTLESKYRFDQQALHPFTTWELKCSFSALLEMSKK